MMRQPTNRQRTIRGKISRGMLFVLGLQLCILVVCLILMGFAGSIRSNEEYKLAAPVKSRAEQLQQFLNSISLLAHSSGHSMAPLLEASDYNAVISLMAQQLENSNASGVFAVLQTLDGKPGVFYLRDRYPSTNYADYSDILYVRGPAQYAKAAGFPLDTQWQPAVEIDETSLYYANPIHAYSDSNARAEQCGYWSDAYIFPQNIEKIISYTLPLVGSDGGVLGVLGFELSANALRSQLSVSEILFDNAVFVFTKLEDTPVLRPESSVVVGAYGSVAFHGREWWPLLPDANNAALYRMESSARPMVAATFPVKLYSSGDYYDGEEWHLIGMVPETQIKAISTQLVKTIAIAMVITIAISLVAVFAVGQWSVAPIHALAEQALENDAGIPALSNIKEVDELAALIYERRHVHVAPDALFEDFIRRVGTLTASERSIFELQAQGKTSEEILDRLCISTNTLKTHNRHIFSKLDVSSRHELNLYITLIKKSGLLEKIMRAAD